MALVSNFRAYWCVMRLLRVLLPVFLLFLGAAHAQGLAPADLPRMSSALGSSDSGSSQTPGLPALDGFRYTGVAGAIGDDLANLPFGQFPAAAPDSMGQEEDARASDTVAGFDGDPQVLRIEPVLADGWLHIDADVHLPISGDLRNFAERGVSLYFTADLEIVKPRRWWFNSEVVKERQTWRLVYNALTRQWRIGTGDLTLPEPSLDDALSLVRNIRGWAVVPATELDVGEHYVGRLRVRLDTSLLARPFQVDALNSSAWALSTPWKDFSFSISGDGLPH